MEEAERTSGLNQRRFEAADKIAELTHNETENLITDRQELKWRLESNGNMGADLSPGDPVAAAALQTIEALENKIEELEAGNA